MLINRDWLCLCSEFIKLQSSVYLKCVFGSLEEFANGLVPKRSGEVNLNSEDRNKFSLKYVNI